MALVVALSVSVPASAGTRSVRATGMKDGKLVFKVKRVQAKTLGSARLRVGRFRRGLAVPRVQRGLRRGVVRVKAPRYLRRSIRRVRDRRTRRRLVRRAARRSRLVLTTRRQRQRQRQPEGLAHPPRSCALPAGARFVSPSGSDSNPGTVAQPWRTLEKAEAEAEPGTAVALRGGQYGARGKVTYLEASGTASKRISIVAYPGEVPILAGHVGIAGNHRRLCGLLFDGPTGPINTRSADNPTGEEVKVMITGDDVELANSEVRGTLWHAGVYLLGAQRARLVGNYIHDNGRFDDPSAANLDHGIYWASGSGVVEGNRLEHNYANAVSLYPDASGVTVRGNTMTGHGRAAVLITENCASNQIVGNEIFGNRKGIQAWNLRGRGNAVRTNRLWNNSEGDLVDLGGVALGANQLL